MRSIFLAVFLVVSAPIAASAQQLIGSYYTTLGQHDFFNSSGGRLTDFGAVLQQDRANFHRFGIRDQNDQGDPVFANRAQRAQIPSIWRYGSGAQGIPGQVARGISAYVYVEIYGSGSNAQYIVVHQGAG